MSRSCWRGMSPVGASSLTTSAPSQARICVAEGPDWAWGMSRKRTPSRALISLTPKGWRRSLVHRLVHGSRGVDLRVDPDVDEGREARLAGTLQGRRDVGGVADLFAVTAEHLRELVVLDPAEGV